MISVKSNICEVTIFSDRALVTRTSTEHLTIGEHILSFDKLPIAIDQNSIQVNGKGNAILKDVKFKQEHFADIPNETIKALYDKKQIFEDTLQDLDDTIIHANMEKEFVDNIAKTLTSEKKESPSQELDPEKWLKMVNYYRAKLDQINKEKRESEKSQRSIKNELQKINNEILGLGNQKSKTKNQVEVLVDVTGEGSVTLFLSYIVHGPCWYPVYDLRASTERKKMNISYNAIIQQNTSEAWEDAAIKLSTAQPQISGRQPELSPWYVEAFIPALPVMRYARAAAKEAEMSQMFSTNTANEVASEEDSTANIMDLERPSAETETGSTSVVFVIGGKNTIYSDNQPHKVTIAIEDFDAHFRYSTVPKLAQYSYLKAKVTNHAGYPLLPGECNVFLDNNFVAHSYIDLVAPSEEFWTFLGVDESMKVEYKFLKKYQKREGLINKKNKIIYEYLIILTNNKKTEEEIVLWDQIPITQNDTIIVELIEPKYEKDSDRLKKNEYNYLEWFFILQPGKKVEIPFVFSIEHPKDLRITGIS